MIDVTCISPVDGSVYATWPAESADSVRARLRAARQAQAGWAARPLAERIALVKESVAKLDAMNDCVYGLIASVWTADVDAAAAIGARVETGTIFMNRCDNLDPALCWTGCKATGRGTSLSSLGFLGLTRPKPYHLRKI